MDKFEERINIIERRACSIRNNRTRAEIIGKLNDVKNILFGEEAISLLRYKAMIRDINNIEFMLDKIGI